MLHCISRFSRLPHTDDNTESFDIYTRRAASNMTGCARNRAVVCMPETDIKPVWERGGGGETCSASNQVIVRSADADLLRIGEPGWRGRQAAAAAAPPGEAPATLMAAAAAAVASRSGPPLPLGGRSVPGALGIHCCACAAGGSTSESRLCSLLHCAASMCRRVGSLDGRMHCRWGRRPQSASKQQLRILGHKMENPTNCSNWYVQLVRLHS